MSEVVVPLNGGLRVHGQATKHLHPNDGVDEEEDPHEKADIGQGLVRMVRASQLQSAQW